MWSDSRRAPDSREEDTWLSDEQLRRVAPAESEPFQSPVPTRMVSNGEYMPHPQTEQQKHVEYRVKELAGEAAKRLGTTRRQFLAGTGGMAAAFIAMNEVFGKRFFNVRPVEMYETAAYVENSVPRDLFVFDDQTHIIRSSMNFPLLSRVVAQGPGPVNTALGFTSNPLNGAIGQPAGVDEFGNPWANWNPAQLGPGSPPNPGPIPTALGEFHLGQYINRMYLQSQTSVSIVSNANLLVLVPASEAPKPATNITDALASEILTSYQTSQCRDFINALAGSRRAFAHAQLYPGVGNLADPAFGDFTQWQIEYSKPDSWKGYCVENAASAFPGAEFTRWRLDDEAVAYPTYSVINANKHMLKEHPGFFNLCIHKGLSPLDSQPGGPNNTPEWGNPDDLVKAASDWPQFNFVIYHSCLRPNLWVLQALQDIENLTGAMPPTTLTDSDGHSVPNIRWCTQFAQIAGGKYVAGAEPTSTSPASPRRLSNIYAELGTTMASMIVTFPTVWSHLIGQLLYYVGSDHIVFGSDSLWYGGPQWQIEALWRFQIPDQIAEQWHYPQLTEQDKRQILGLNSARNYGLLGRETLSIGTPGSPYRRGNLASYASLMQPGSSIDSMLQGVGYPTPVTPATLIPDDNFTALKKERDESGAGRSNTRYGWIRTV